MARGPTALKKRRSIFKSQEDDNEKWVTLIHSDRWPSLIFKIRVLCLVDFSSLVLYLGVA